MTARRMVVAAIGHASAVVRFDAQVLMLVNPEIAFDLSVSIDVHRGSFKHSGELAFDGVTAGLIGCSR